MLTEKVNTITTVYSIANRKCSRVQIVSACVGDNVQRFQCVQDCSMSTVTVLKNLY